MATATLSTQTATASTRNQEPTLQSIEAARGPYEIATQSVPPAVNTGFGGGTIYYPATTGAGKFGAVALSPGYMEKEYSFSWLGTRLASQGFVVFIINTQNSEEFPSARTDELLASLNYLTQTSEVRDRVDPNRLAVMGHSMGGGAALEAAEKNQSLRAVISMTPWNIKTTYSDIKTPTLIIGAQYDNIAPVHDHAQPSYASLPNDLAKSYLELRNGNHFSPNMENTAIARSSTVWLKRFVDGDTRYNKFICPGPTVGDEFNIVQSNCPIL
ncbi:alpha/beta hydrolase family protein [Rathayibacter toxicus]|nr:alpha/beta hydrolase [Rathayibacter toxicus]PPG20727.1 alpha/beta hydrolase [Rathayibacter toxicus]PPG45831.1 alpha/beta hydrolase [Rathayibacter toxicus]PPH21774.1 alpha/beta hydrolase [Rathayibacter toxicus]PPH56203.1 alpha/beta hydrolase [Rathayibacter toxicus]PPH58299.1 alpha/beta hydrolase [Rathayibacter toxicus]